jgi:hypothetical protein
VPTVYRVIVGASGSPASLQALRRLATWANSVTVIIP